MQTDEMNRFFTLLQDQGRTLKQQGELLAAISQSQQDTRERLFGGPGPTPGAIPYLYERVGKHEKQINFWRGALGVVGFGGTAMITGLIAWLSKHVK